MRDPRRAMRWTLIAANAFIGTIHLVATDAFLPIMPDWVPQPRLVVIATGLCELAAIMGLTIPRLRRLTGILLALYAVCVFPANVKHAVEGIDLPGLPASWWYHGPRLAAQPLLVWWALYATRVVTWPFATRRG